MTYDAQDPDPWSGLRSLETGYVLPPSMRGGECNALAHLDDRPVDEFDRALAVPALVGDRGLPFAAGLAPPRAVPPFGGARALQFSARILQERERGIHPGLCAQRIAYSKARNDQNADQQLLLGHKT